MLLFMSRFWKLKKHAFEYLFAMCPLRHTQKMKLKKCIVGRPEYFDMVNKTKQKKIKLKKKKRNKNKDKEDKTKQNKTIKINKSINQSKMGVGSPPPPLLCTPMHGRHSILNCGKDSLWVRCSQGSRGLPPDGVVAPPCLRKLFIRWA